MILVTQPPNYRKRYYSLVSTALLLLSLLQNTFLLSSYNVQSFQSEKSIMPPCSKHPFQNAQAGPALVAEPKPCRHQLDFGQPDVSGRQKCRSGYPHCYLTSPMLLAPAAPKQRPRSLACAYKQGQWEKIQCNVLVHGMVIMERVLKYRISCYTPKIELNDPPFLFKC